MPQHADTNIIEVEQLVTHYGEREVLKGVDLQVRQGEIMVIMGGSGCGKSTVMRSLTGLLQPKVGRIHYEGVSFWDAPAADRAQTMRRFGVMYQSGALWSSMTLLDSSMSINSDASSKVNFQRLSNSSH